ncbi:MAG: lactonase family protein [Verrucomicrobiota bacterium]
MFLKNWFPLLALTASLHAAPVYIGTNTGGKSASKGIYVADFDDVTGKLTKPTLAAEYGNPGFLALHPTKPLIYACGAPKQKFADDSGSVAAFAIRRDHGLDFLGEASCMGKGPCHVAVDATGRTVAVANYGDGSYATVRLDESGIPGKAVSVFRPEGSGPNKDRQNGPHAHGVYFNKANNRLLMPDLGLDQVFIHPFDAETSALSEPLPSLKSKPGAGPRHLAFSPDEKNLYVINELENAITTSNRKQDGYGAVASVPTLPADFSGGSTTAEIEVHPNGNFVYGSNRGHDSIVVYQRDPRTGALTFVQHAPCGGKTPRHFKIAPSGKWLLCGQQDSNAISILPLDPETGMLGAPIHTVSTPSPICLVFAR